MVIAYDRQVRDEEYESRGEERQALDGDTGRGCVGLQEQTDQQPRKQYESGRAHCAAQQGREQRDASRFPHALAVADAEVVAYDRLRRLRDGVADHERERSVVARDAERAHAVVAQVAHKGVVSHEHQHSHRKLAEHGRRAYAALVADIAERQTQALSAPLHPLGAHRAREEEQIAHCHDAARRAAQRRGEGRAAHAPTQRKYEQIVESDVENRRGHAAPHGRIRRAVDADDEKRDRDPHVEHDRGHEPQHVVEHRGQQRLRGAQRYGDMARECHYEYRGDDGDDGHEYEGLRYVHPRRAQPSSTHVDGYHHRASRADHEAQSREDQKQRYADVHRRDAVAAHAVADEDAVDGRHGRDAEHAQQSGDEKAAEKFRYFHRAEIDSVSLHNM